MSTISILRLNAVFAVQIAPVMRRDPEPCFTVGSKVGRIALKLVDNAVASQVMRICKSRCELGTMVACSAMRFNSNRWQPPPIKPTKRRSMDGNAFPLYEPLKVGASWN